LHNTTAARNTFSGTLTALDPLILSESSVRPVNGPDFADLHSGIGLLPDLFSKQTHCGLNGKNNGNDSKGEYAYVKPHQIHPAVRGIGFGIICSAGG
jgi:hypothetical protein